MSHPKDCICVYCESTRKSESRTDIIVARQRIKELEAITQGFARQLCDARADERRKVVEEIINLVNRVMTTDEGIGKVLVDCISRQYLQNKPVPEVKP